MKQYPLSDVKVGDTVWIVYQYQSGYIEGRPITIIKIGRKYVYLGRYDTECKINKEENTHFPCSVVDSTYDIVCYSESHYQEYQDYLKEQKELMLEIQKMLNKNIPISTLIEVRDLLKKKEG